MKLGIRKRDLFYWVIITLSLTILASLCVVVLVDMHRSQQSETALNFNPNGLERNDYHISSAVTSAVKSTVLHVPKVPRVSFPFKNIKNQAHIYLPIIAISAPFRSKQHEDLYQEYKNKGCSFLGISSYLTFPDKIQNPHECRFHERRKHDYVGMVSAWAYCTRNPSQKILSVGMPHILMTEADLKNIRSYTRKHQQPPEYDFLYVCLDDGKDCRPGWQSHNRNWILAQICFHVICVQYKLRVLIVGRTHCTLDPLWRPYVTVKGFMNFHAFQTEMQKCRFLFVPNIDDASPRVITEALCYDIPVLVNRNIVGGWHNVVSGVTGEFFTDENDLKPALNKLLHPQARYSPRHWFEKNRAGNSRKLFAEFIKQHFASVLKKSINLTEAYI